MAIKSCFILLLLNSLLVQFGNSKVIKHSNGLSYITGRGCGTIKPIKYFTSMPRDTSELTCSIIKSKELEKLEGNSFGNENCEFASREIDGKNQEYFPVSVETKNTLKQ